MEPSSVINILYITSPYGTGTSTSEAVVKMKLESMLVLNDYLTTHHQMDTADDVDLQEEAVEDKDSEKNMGKKRKKYLATAK